MSTPKEHELFDSPQFKEGLAIGKALGSHEAQEEARRAHSAGEIELWLAHVRPKTLEEWDAWEKEHGENFGNRWKAL